MAECLETKTRAVITSSTPFECPVLTLSLREPGKDSIFYEPICTMASTTSTSTEPLPSPDDIAIKAVNKRYEGLVTVRTKAIKGKGAWYWVHLEPILIRNTDTGLPKSVKLKCSLCDSVFSASNPSRTASEHLKRGTCPNFSSGLRPNSSLSPLPISSVAMTVSNNHKKRSSPQMDATTPPSYQNHSLAMVESSRFCDELGYSQVHNSVGVVSNTGMNHQQQRHLVLSGGKEDLCALAMFEDSVKRLKSPKTSPSPVLNKEQVNSALELLSDWFYESCGSVSFSTLEHPKFQAFLSQVGLPTTLRREFSGPRFDAKFNESKAESEAKIRDAMFFQVASGGWKNKNWHSLCCGGENLVKFTVNLPNGTSVFQKAVFTGGVVSPKYAEDILWETITAISGGVVQKCVGIISDKYKAKALRNLEIQNHWMVNISCQLQGFISLIKDFNKELPLFRAVTENCLKVANFINTESQVRNTFLKYRMQELDYAGLLRVPSPECDPRKNFSSAFPMLDDILSCARVLQMVILEDSFKMACMEDPLAREVAGLVQAEGFWNELEAVCSLVKLIRGIVLDLEAERPLVGRCLPLWEELRTKVKDWCAKYSVLEGAVEKILEKRFRKLYHPAWSAAFILDPLYLIKDTSGKYLPPFKLLTREQEKDVDKLLTKLASREEAHVVLMELMKWRSEGLDPLYAQAVQMKQRDPVTGKMKVANPLSSRLVWETCLSEFKTLGKIAVRLIFLHATSCGFKSSWSFMRKISSNKHSRVALERAQKMIYIAAHAKLERRDFSNEEERDAELFSMSGSEDGMLAEVFAEAPLIRKLQNDTKDASVPKFKMFIDGELELLETVVMTWVNLGRKNKSKNLCCQRSTSNRINRLSCHDCQRKSLWEVEARRTVGMNKCMIWLKESQMEKHMTHHVQPWFLLYKRSNLSQSHSSVQPKLENPPPSKTTQSIRINQAMAYWSAENATKAYLSTLKMGQKAKEPDVAEFISAIAAGNNAQLMVVACGGAADSTTLALVAAAHQTGGHVICIVRGLEDLNASKNVLGLAAGQVQFVVGEAQELLLSQYEAADFVLIDCNLENHEEILKSVQVSGKQKGTVVVGYNAFSRESNNWWSCGTKTQLLPIGGGLLVTKFGSTGSSPKYGSGMGKMMMKSRWVVKVDRCTGEEHVFRVRIHA